jgi:hypothetical protein
MAGTYTVTITSASNCTSTATATVVVNANPVASVSNIERCGPGAVTLSVSNPVEKVIYKWYSNADLSDESPAIGTTYSAEIETDATYYITATNEAGCVSASSSAIASVKTALNFAPNVTGDAICGPGAVNLTANIDGKESDGVTYTYNWFSDAEHTISAGSGKIITPSVTETSTFYVNVVSSEGCASEFATVTATVKSIPSAPVVTDGKVCVSGQVELTATGSGILKWYSDASLVSQVAIGTTFTPTVSGTTSYYVTSNVDGCISAASTVTATVNPLPTVSVNSPKVCVGSSVVLTATTNTGTGFVWTPGGLTTASITVNPASDATYVVTVTDGATGCSNSATSTVTVSGLPIFTNVTSTIDDCGPFVSLVGKYEITNGRLQSITLNSNNVANASKVGAGTYVITAVNDAGCTSTATITVKITCYTFTLSQGFYGSTNGTKCLNITGSSTRYTAVQLIGAILKDNPMTLGVFASGKSFTARSENASALNKIMPGGSGGSALNNNYGNTTGSNWFTSGILTNKGKINNVLLSQTITMWLNMNMKENNVGNWLLADIGSVPSAVISAAGGVASAKVSDLVRLASRALGGESLTGGVTFSSLVSALDLVVRKFDNSAGEAGACSNVFGDHNPTMLTSSARVVGAGDEMVSSSANKVEVENAQLVVKAFPNPYIDQVTFNLTVKNAGKGSLVIYNMLGQKVTNLFEGNMQANSTQTIRYNVPFAQRKNLVYVFRQNDTISTGKLVSGK